MYLCIHTYSNTKRTNAKSTRLHSRRSFLQESGKSILQ